MASVNLVVSSEDRIWYIARVDITRVDIFLLKTGSDILSGGFWCQPSHCDFF